MRTRTLKTLAASSMLALSMAASAAGPAATPPATAPAAGPLGATSPRLYAADCGAIRVGDMAGFSDLGEQAGQVRDFIVPCFLVVHPGGAHGWPTMLFDTRKFADWFDRHLRR